MQKPNLERVWHTFVKLTADRIPAGEHIEMLRFSIAPVLRDLMNRGIIGWYCFLIHDKKSGVPAHLDDSLYFHIRLGLAENTDPGVLVGALPSCFVGTEKVPKSEIDSMGGIDKTRLRSGAIEEAWRIIGEQCEWLLDLLDIYVGTASVFPDQIGQFLHYFSNITQLTVK